MKANKFINIGGVPYSTRAVLNGFFIDIIGYDINTERHLIISDASNQKRRIELDNSDLKLREKFTKTYK